MITVTVLAVITGATTWVIRDRERLMRERDGALEREQIAMRRRANTSADLWDIIDQHGKLIHHMKARQAELERKFQPGNPLASGPK